MLFVAYPPFMISVILGPLFVCLLVFTTSIFMELPNEKNERVWGALYSSSSKRLRYEARQTTVRNMRTHHVLELVNYNVYHFQPPTIVALDGTNTFDFIN